MLQLASIPKGEGEGEFHASPEPGCRWETTLWQLLPRLTVAPHPCGDHSQPCHPTSVASVETGKVTGVPLPKHVGSCAPVNSMKNQSAAAFLGFHGGLLPQLLPSHLPNCLSAEHLLLPLNTLCPCWSPSFQSNVPNQLSMCTRLSLSRGQVLDEYIFVSQTHSEFNKHLLSWLIEKFI